MNFMMKKESKNSIRLCECDSEWMDERVKTRWKGCVELNDEVRQERHLNEQLLIFNFSRQDKWRKFFYLKEEWKTNTHTTGNAKIRKIERKNNFVPSQDEKRNFLSIVVKKERRKEESTLFFRNWEYYYVYHYY